MTNPDQPQNGTSLPPARVPSYAPIRAQIAAALSPEDRDRHTATEICLLVAARAHGKESAWLKEREALLGRKTARTVLQDMKEDFADEIAAVLQVSQALEAHLVASGLTGHLASPDSFTWHVQPHGE